MIYRVPDSFPGAGRRVYPGFLQYTGFVAMNPDRHASSHYDYFKDLIKGDDASAEAHRKFYDEYNAVLDMDADYYLETIKTVFQDYNLVHGTWDVRSPTGKIERVRPQDITTTALFTVEGELDDISGSGQTKAAHDLCTGIVRKEQHHLEAKGAGHYGIFSGRRWREIVYPQVRAFIQRHEKAPAKSSAPAATSAPDLSASTAKAQSEPLAAAPIPVQAVANTRTAEAPRTGAKGVPLVTAPQAPAQAAAPAAPVAKRAGSVQASAKATAPKAAAASAVVKPKAVQAAASSPPPAGVATRWVKPEGATATSTAATSAAATGAKRPPARKA